ncbi:MAG: UbiX family flavin prenyltransferase [Dissulfurimicrobium sp.]|uniref:UbiX family flavin prenyltransferase n=1 Tax=Dissulfurimicrobium hydrothermale TaxID=1750598 RepID=UPI001EDBCD43|nr:UbiX family flavin prenyltransferase [Dissulfurimicrobium hydrothermale]UKL14305.1 UbiX family flavin prenyltransferase [Dissulfurimicrobium hydrothermale]
MTNQINWTENAPVLLAITGASGAIYSLKFMGIMKDLGQEVHLVISKAGMEVTRLELGDEGCRMLKKTADVVYGVDDLTARPASGSARWQAMVILPCTMGTLAAIAHGISGNLIHRAADCFLKERRPLVLVPRETPFNRIHLRNMLLAEEAGAVIYPAMPSFYHKPRNIDEMALFFAGRIAEFLGFNIENLKRWEGRCGV